jgi:APA family basic amino acid/polyamine antiporter
MVVAIIIIGKDIDKIMTFNMFLESLGLALAAATIYYFRKEHDKKLKARWTYITPYTTAFYILTYVFVIISVTIKSPTGSMLAILLMTGLFMIFLSQEN